MNRKFRVWDKKNSRYVEPGKDVLEGVYLLYRDIYLRPNGELVYSDKNSDVRYYKGFKEIDDRADIEWYIGRKDKNKVEICQSDIVEYADLLSDEWMLNKEKTVGTIRWLEHKCGYCVQEIKENHKGGHFVALWDSIDEIEVIGNIHEHKHLIPADNEL